MQYANWKDMTPNVKRRTFGPVCSAKIQISLRIRADWWESSLSAVWKAKDAKFLHADNADSDQTARMHRLFWVFVWRICQKVCFLTLRAHVCVLFCSNRNNLINTDLTDSTVSGLSFRQSLERRFLLGILKCFVLTDNILSGTIFRFCFWALLSNIYCKINFMTSHGSYNAIF